MWNEKLSTGWTPELLIRSSWFFFNERVYHGEGSYEIKF